MKMIVRQVFQHWLHGTDWRYEAKISSILVRAAKANNVALTFYEFWQKRPTRLFKLLKQMSQPTQNYFSFLDQEIQRLPIALTWNRYNSDQLENLRRLALAAKEDHIVELIKNYQLPQSSVVVPLLVQSDDLMLPVLILSEFSELAILKNKKTSVSHFDFHQQALTYFSRRYPGKRIPCLVCLPFFCDGFNIIGNSYQLPWLVSAWFKFHDFENFSTICCSGSVDFGTGEIGLVNGFKAKAETAIQAGCDLFLTSGENVHQEVCDAGSIIGFYDLDSVFHWLLINSGFTAVKSEIHSWLSGNLDLPGEKNFVRFFREESENNDSWLDDWRKLTINQSINQRFNKLSILFENRFKCADDNIAEKNCSRPDFVEIAALPLSLFAKISGQPLQAEREYLRFRKKILCAQAEVHLASRLAREVYTRDFFSSSEFFLLRRRFPLLLWLFMREPVELLHFLSGFDFLLNNEIVLLEFVLSDLLLHAEEYSAVSSTHRCDSEIMHKAMKISLPAADFMMAENRLPMRKRLALLYQAQSNFNQKRDKITVFAKGAAVCQKLFEAHLKRLSQFSEICERNSQNPVLLPLNRAKKNNKKTHSSEIRKACFLKRLELKQPGLQIARALLENDQSFNLTSLLNIFSKRIYLEPAGEFMVFCLAHFYGYFRPARKVSLLRRFGLSQLIGAIQGGSITERENSFGILTAGIRNFRPGTEMLLLLFLPEDCILGLKGFLNEIILKKALNQDEKRQKNLSVMKFMAAVLYEKHGFSECKEIWNDWQEQLVKFNQSPALVRKTIQALIPVFYLMTDQEELGRHALNSQFNCLNRPQFLFEYVRCFILKRSFFVSSGWNMKFEHEVFASLVLFFLSRNSIFEMQQYLLREVEDFDNAQFALELQGFCNFHRQPDHYP